MARRLEARKVRKYNIFWVVTRNAFHIDGDFWRRYSEWMHIPNCINDVRAISEKIDENATWKEKLASSQWDPSYWIMQ